MDAHYCHKCNTPWENDKRSPGFKETCSGCGAYLHCCKNCRFHVPTAHNQCYIPDTEYVVNRAGLNFCEEFAFRDGIRMRQENQHGKTRPMPLRACLARRIMKGPLPPLTTCSRSNSTGKSFFRPGCSMVFVVLCSRTIMQHIKEMLHGYVAY